MNRKQAFLLNAKILSLSVFPERADALIPILKSINEKDRKWWVYYSSNHLILPSLYHLLNKHLPASSLPSDLRQYLEHIYALNSERNQKIMHQALELNRLLRENAISAVFLKGVGHLFDALYPHAGMRMMSDIDVVVAPEQMLPAAKLLLEKGYFSHKAYNPDSFDSTLHYPMLVHEDQVAGVEIHARILNYLYDGLLPDYPQGVKPSELHPEIQILSLRDRIVHNFVHSQLMHSHHYTGMLSLKDMYDYFLLQQRGAAFPKLPKHMAKSEAYHHLVELYFKGVKLPRRYNFYPSLYVRHQAALRMPSTMLRLHYFLIMILQKYLVLPFRAVWNPQARNFVWSRITNPRWYRTHIDAWKRMLKKRS